MTTVYPWQEVANQGYGLYGSQNGRTIIGPGSGEAIDRGINFLGEGKDSVLLRVAKEDTQLLDLWKGGKLNVRKGDIIMNYGAQETEWMANEIKALAKKYNRTHLTDRNFSMFPEVMETTYVDAKTGEYLTGRLGPDSKGVIEGYKRANTGFAFLPEGTPVLSSEAKLAGEAPVLSKAFEPVALDKAGCYLPSKGKFLKDYKPVDEASSTIYNKFKKAFDIAQKAEGYAKAGELAPASAQKAVSNAWKVVVAIASKGKIH